MLTRILFALCFLSILLAPALSQTPAQDAATRDSNIDTYGPLSENIPGGAQNWTSRKTELEAWDTLMRNELCDPAIPALEWPRGFNTMNCPGANPDVATYRSDTIDLLKDLRWDKALTLTANGAPNAR
jgi:hypothetical protein